MRKFLSCLLVSLFVYLPVASAVVPTPQSPVQKPKDFDKGFQAAMEVVKEYPIETDVEKTRRVNEIGYKVAQRAAPNSTYYSFRIIKMEEPNAFSLPGGFVFVTTGMLDLNLTDDELAALLGHEITHVRNEHSRKMAKRETIMNLLYQALIMGIAFGMKDRYAYDPVTGLPTRDVKSEVLQGSQAFGLIFQELLLEGFSRELELEADREGMIYAAGAGFNPQGTNTLFEKMHRSIYEEPGFGYWRTHPYLEDRMEIARTLSANVEKSKSPPDDTEYRQKTQRTFLGLLDTRKSEDEKIALRKMALQACDQGPTAEDLRWWFINRDETRERGKEPFFRDYGLLAKRYDTALKETGTNGSAGFQAKLQQGLDKIKQDKEAIRPMYEDVLSKGNFDTEMLQRYLSNYPDSPRIPEVQYHLAENYRILQKTSDAVELYLKVLASDTASPWQAKSRDSLMQIIPRLDQLSACYKMATQSKDPELKRLSQDRMHVLAASFNSLENGYNFRRSYPTSEFEKPVREQMAKLAAETLNEGKLYQAVGEYQKALDQFNKILRYCSDLPVADQVKDSIVTFQELKEVKG